MPFGIEIDVLSDRGPEDKSVTESRKLLLDMHFQHFSYL
jgi:hypothetical protein